MSFVYISRSLERHSLTGLLEATRQISTELPANGHDLPKIERPRLSSLLVLLLSGCFCYAASALSRLFPDRLIFGFRRIPDPAVLNGGCANSNDALFKGSSAHLPKRPGKWSLPLVISCIVIRLEMFHRVNSQQQCATPGIEVRSS